MSGEAKVAYVSYGDGYKAIVGVSLIEHFNPVTCADTAKNKKIYWKQTFNGSVEESYHSGDVLLLGSSFSDLIQKMTKKRIAVPDSIFYESDAEGAHTTEKVKCGKQKTVSRRKRSPSPESSGDELVEKRLLRKEQEHTRALKKKIRKLEEKLDIVEKRNGRLQDMLHEKFDALVKHTMCAKTAPPLVCTPNSGCSAIHDQVPSAPQVSPSEPVFLEEQNGHLPQVVPVSQAHFDDMQQPAEAGDTSQVSNGPEETAILAVVNDQVHLGNDVFIHKDRWQWLLTRSKDGTFCKEATKTLWPLAELRDRSVTGAPCRRYLKAENPGPAKKALCPHKVAAVANGFAAYIAQNENEMAPSKRMQKMNRYIAEMLRDIRR